MPRYSLAAVEADFQLARRPAALGRAEKIHVQPRLAGLVEQDRNLEDLTIVECETQLPAVGSHDDVDHPAVAQLPNGFRDPPEILDRGERHGPGAAPLTLGAAR